MVATVLVSGKLFKAPERKTSAGGKAFIAATIREGGGDATTWWKALCFDADAGAELMKLNEGETVAVSGGLKADTYEKDGKHRIGFTVFVDSIISARRKPRTSAP
jgi:single-stranded DNA-binding protein